jgi:hypothetical protein
VHRRAVPRLRGAEKTNWIGRSACYQRNFALGYETAHLNMIDVRDQPSFAC